jgi:carboxyl-terminal processing protease
MQFLFVQIYNLQPIKIIMFKKIKIALMILVPTALLSMGFYLKKADLGEDLLVRVILENLKNFHFAPVEIDDTFSEKAFENYMEMLDGNKRFFIQADIDELSKFKYSIDDESRNGTYNLLNKSIEILEKRQLEVQQITKELLSKPFNFELKETVEFGDIVKYAQNNEELKEKWRLYLKYNVMLRLASATDIQEKAIENKDSGYKVESMDSLEFKAREGVQKTHDEWFERITKVERKDRLNVYVNALTAVFDPHTNYFPPADKENFDIRMSGKLEGIGASLQEKDGYIKVVKIIAGSPSALQGELKENDLILRVAQGKEESVDIVNARIDDAVKLIRGKKGTEVRLTVKKPDGTTKVIPIIRDVVVLEETYAKSAIVNDKDNNRVGYIYLPSFYADFSGQGGRTSWKDVKAEIEKLKEEGVTGIILDLRNNGGGSLGDVVEMGGLFIPEGPIVQVKARGEAPYIMKDNNKSVTWDGALVIMVNSFSASASEIMAAAMQDYKRAVILGAGATHGKGTVQRFIELNQTIRDHNAPDLGSLKLTIQKFYRINGDATQLKGIESDINMPDNYTYIKTGEKEDAAAMPFDKIGKAPYKVENNYIKNLDQLKRNSIERTKLKDEIQLLDENAKRWQKQNEKKVFDLNMVSYRGEEKKNVEYNKKYEELFKPIDGFTVSFPKVDVNSAKDDEGKKARQTDWQSNLKKDLYLYEALQIIEDLLKQ